MNKDQLEPNVPVPDSTASRLAVKCKALEDFSLSPMAEGEHREVGFENIALERYGESVAKRGYYIRYGQQPQDILWIASGGLFDINRQKFHIFGRSKSEGGFGLEISRRSGQVYDFMREDDKTYTDSRSTMLMIYDDGTQARIIKDEFYGIPLSLGRMHVLKLEAEKISRSFTGKMVTFPKNIPYIPIDITSVNSGSLQVKNQDGVEIERPDFVVGSAGATFTAERCPGTPIMSEGGTVLYQLGPDGRLSLYTVGDAFESKYVPIADQAVRAKGGLYITPLDKTFIFFDDHSGLQVGIQGSKI